MKKLMIAAALICSVAMAKAASTDWAFSWMVYDANIADGYSCYSFNSGSAASTLANYLISGDYADSSAFDDAFGSADKTAGTSFTSGMSMGSNKWNGPSSNPFTTVSFLALISTDEGATVYWLDNVDTTGFVYNPPNQGTQDFIMTPFSSGEVKYSSEPTPEPTSGLLLLLGVAGLALRRKLA